MEELRLQIETNPYAFASWLNDELLSFYAIPIIIGKAKDSDNLVKRLEFGPPEIDEPVKKFEHYRLRVTGTVQVTGPDVEIGGARMWIPGMTVGRLDSVVSIKIRDLGCNRIEIVGECEIPEACGYAFILAGKIAETFPLLKEPKFVGPTLEELKMEYYSKFFPQAAQEFSSSTKDLPKWLTKQALKGTQARVSDVVQAIQNWIPKQRYAHEESYVAALSEYLVGQGIEAPEQQGMSLVDILAVYEIGIEAKLNPGRSEYDRLYGQIIRQLEEFGIVIVLILRPDKRDLLEEYKSRFAHDTRVVFIAK